MSTTAPTTEAFPTPVNSQITDAVTQASAKRLAEAPAVAMGTIYQSLAHATGVLFENAVNTQQQQNILAQSAATQGAILIYSVDTAAVAAGKVGPAGVSDTVTAAVSGLGTPQAQLAQTPATGLSRQVEDAITSTLQHSLGHSGDVAYGARAAADALAAAIDRVNRVTYENSLRMIKLAGTAVCIAAMARAPDKREDYQAVLDRIATL